MNHTKGPWEVRPAITCKIGVYKKGHGFVAFMASAEEANANAYLIASAPELLEALQKCVETLTDKRIGTTDYMEGSDIYDDFENVSESAKQAIAKAEGK